MDNMAASDINVMETSMMSQSSNLSATAGMSMREKSQLKRRINKEHNSNFRAGYVPVNEEYLYKAGIRGRKRFLLYACVIVLLVLAVLNTALTAWLLWIYRISHQGMDALEFTRSSAGQLLRIYDEARFESLTLNAAYLASRRDRNLEFTGNNSKFVLSTTGERNGTMVEIDKDAVRFHIDDLNLLTPSGKEYFSLADLTIPHMKNVKNLHADLVETSKIQATDVKQFIIESNDWLNLTGSDGVKVTSNRETVLRAGRIFVTSSNGSTAFDGHVGMYVSRQIPQVLQDSTIDTSIITTKLCVCGKNGRVFAVPVNKPGMGCADASDIKSLCES